VRDARDGRLRALAAEVAGEPGVLDVIVDAARRHSPAVAALPRAEIADHALAVVAVATDAFTAGRPLAAADLDVVARLGATRAEQGVPIAALLDGFQAGRSAVLRVLIGRLRDAGIPPDSLLDGMLELDELITALEHQLTHAHRGTELQLARTARDQRAQLLRQVLLGAPDVDRRQLRQLGFDVNAEHHCVVTAERDARAAEALEARLAAATRGTFGLVNGVLAGLCGSGPPADAAAGALVVVGPPVPLAALPESYRLCCAARDTAVRHGVAGVLPLTDLAVDTALDAAPELGRLLAGALLDRLSPDSAFHRELVRTALAYLEHAGRIDATAAALHVHPNTVKYRLRRLRTLTGQPLDPPADGTAVRQAVRWWWALRVWRERAG
jgi:hypothetical protein